MLTTSSIHIESLDPQDTAIARILGGLGEVLTGVQEKYVQCAEEKQQAQQQLESQNLPETNIVADGKQNELIAVLNTIYESGMVTGSKKEFAERMGKALGCPQLAANYSAQLHKIKMTYKYDAIFENLAKVAEREKTKND